MALRAADRHPAGNPRCLVDRGIRDRFQVVDEVRQRTGTRCERVSVSRCAVQPLVGATPSRWVARYGPAVDTSWSSPR